MNRRNRVLVVDDDPVNVAIVREILAESCELRSESDGRAALDAIAAWAPDLVLLDIMMPGLDGYETCRRIRGAQRLRTTKVVLVSGKSSVGERMQGYTAGADDYIVKPFVEDELLAKVQVFARLSRTEELDRFKSDVLQLFSHEMRTPLNAIIGLSEMLCDDDSLRDDVRESLHDIATGGRQLLEFVRKAQLLRDLNRDCERPTTVASIAAHVRNAVAVERERHASSTIRLTVEADLEIAADWGLLDSVLAAVIDNAIVHGGGLAEVSVTAADAEITVAVRDHGPGINPEHRPRLYEPFHVGDLQHHQAGHGLNLAIASRTMALNGGRLEMTDAPGGGAIFRLTFAVTRLPVEQV